MARKRGIKGTAAPIQVSEWEPLLDLAPDHVADFRWVGAEVLAGGARLQVYKHRWTCAYLHLDGDGRFRPSMPGQAR